MSVTTFVITDEKKELLKKTICKGSSDDELELFGHICKHTGLDPFMRQIYPVFRKERNTDGSYSNKMTVQTSIDGFRLIAERTGNYSPGKESTYTYAEDKKTLVSATSYVKKRTSDGTWHDIAATAFFSEYAQTWTDKTSGTKKPTQFWEKMPHVMLSKCAEALALRKAFPAELSGIYTADEMAQAHKPEAELPKERTEITEEEWAKLDVLVSSINDEEYIKKLAVFVDAPTLWDIQPKDYERVMKSLTKNAKERGVLNEQTDVA